MPRWLRHRFRFGRTRSGVPVLVHWSVPAICLFLLGVQVRHIVPAAAGLAAYLSVLFLHESGHRIIAERRGCRVLAIEIYPFHGFCRYEPTSRYDGVFVAWGGFLAQAAVAVPLILLVMTFGYTPFDVINVVIAILGFFNLGIGCLNLLPIRPLDGSTAWSIVPLAWARLRRRPTNRPQTALEALEDAVRKASKSGNPK